jgi:hypothetical protein
MFLLELLLGKKATFAPQITGIEKFNRIPIDPNGERSLGLSLKDYHIVCRTNRVVIYMHTL